VSTTNATIHVRCPRCRGLSAVPSDAIGRAVACPFCDDTFAAVPDVPVVRPVKRDDIPLVFVAKKAVVATIDDESQAEPTDRTPAIAAALMPLGIPLGWAILVATGRGEPLFTPGVPIALGLGATALGLGAALTRDWSPGLRLRAILALVVLSYGTGIGLFVMKKDWAEAVRKRFGRDELGWQLRETAVFQVKFPGQSKPDPNPLLPKWNWMAFRYADPRPTGDRYRAAHGASPDELAPLGDAAWFDEVRKQLTAEDAGDVTRESDLFQQGYVGREFAFTRPDGATNLTVRIYRAGERVILLAAEGPLLPADAKDVTIFFRSLFINTNRR
jgi:hypothetical protein